MSPRSDMVEVVAPAKINLSLRVLGRRDDGYHDIESLVVPISLADRLTVHAHADPGFRTLSLALDVRGEPDLVRPVPADQSNLVVRAAAALAERAGVRGFAEFVLEKRIPTAAGLGGGSSDAAAALRALNDLWGCGLGTEALAGIAEGLGSDVPGLLWGGPVRISGRGERVRPAGEAVSLDLLVVPFDFGIRTADAYQWWDEDGGPRAPDGPHPNDLEGPVIQRRPRIGEAKRLLLEAGLSTVLMSGSGPTVVGIVPPVEIDSDVADAVEEVAGRRPVRTRAGPD